MSASSIKAILSFYEETGKDEVSVAARKELARLETAEARANEFGRKLEEMEQYYATAMLEPCPDEEHCTCVPALRKRAEAAEKAVQEARKVMKHIADPYLYENETGHFGGDAIHYRRVAIAWLAANPEVKE